MSTTDQVQKILLDSFERVRGLVASLTDGLTAEVSTYRPDAQANSIGWLIWHLTRVQDSHLAGAAGTEQVWVAQGWVDSFSLPFALDATGYGQGEDEVGAVQVPAELLAGYHAAVHQATVEYVQQLDAAELERVVDTRWNPPVTVAVRLVSVLGDCLQHVGQAAYVRGLADRR
jgi:hypothetical protein